MHRLPYRLRRSEQLRAAPELAVEQQLRDARDPQHAPARRPEQVLDRPCELEGEGVVFKYPFTILLLTVLYEAHLCLSLI